MTGMVRVAREARRTIASLLHKSRKSRYASSGYGEVAQQRRDYEPVLERQSCSGDPSYASWACYRQFVDGHPDCSAWRDLSRRRPVQSPRRRHYMVHAAARKARRNSTAASRRVLSGRDHKQRETRCSLAIALHRHHRLLSLFTIAFIPVMGAHQYAVAIDVEDAGPTPRRASGTQFRSPPGRVAAPVHAEAGPEPRTEGLTGVRRRPGKS